MWILLTALILIGLFFLIPSSSNTSVSIIKPENRNKPATKRQLEYLKMLAGPCDIRFKPALTPHHSKRVIEFIRQKIQLEINAGLSRERASQLIDAVKAGVYGPEEIFEALNITRRDLDRVR